MIVRIGDVVYLRCRVENIEPRRTVDPFVIPPVRVAIIQKDGTPYDPGAYMYAEAHWLIAAGGAKVEILGDPSANGEAKS